MSKDEIKLPDYDVVDVISTFSQAKGWGIRQLNIPNTWTVTQGDGKIAYIIDSGLTDHNDISDNIIADKSANFLPSWSEESNDPMDRNGHSTHCCGIAAAKDNTRGMVGVAPKAKLVTGKVFDKSGSSGLQTLIDALDYAYELKPDVVSMSLGTGVYNQQIHDTIKELHKINIPVICAAGNEGAQGVSYPAKLDETIAVGAYGENGKIADFSSIGETVDFAAPGVNIYSSWLFNRYAYLNGTSMACPFMTGVVLLLLAKHEKQELETGENDCKTVEQIREHLIKYADDKGAVGKDKYWGYGVVDVEKLILGLAAPDKPEKPKKQTFLEWLRGFLFRIFG